MNKKTKIASLSVLAGFLTISCNLPALLSSQLQGLFGQPTPLPTQTPHASLSVTAEPEPQPITPDDTIQLIDRRIFEEEDEPRYRVDGLWPNFEGSESLITAFNIESDRLIGTIKEDFLLAVADGQGAMEGQGVPPLSYLIFDYDLTYADQQLFSIYLAFDQYVALSAHPFPFSHALNYDAQNGAFMSLDELFLAGTNYINEIGSQIDPILESKGFGYTLGTAAEVMHARENWNLLTEGLRINFDVYEVAPYAAGPQNILIPWRDIAEIINPNGPAASFIN